MRVVSCKSSSPVDPGGCTAPDVKPSVSDSGSSSCLVAVMIMSLSAAGEIEMIVTVLEGASGNDDEVSVGEGAGEVSIVLEGPDSFSTSFNPWFSFNTVDEPNADVADALSSRGCVCDVPVHGTSLRASLDKNESLVDRALLLYTFDLLELDLLLTAGFST